MKKSWMKRALSLTAAIALALAAAGAAEMSVEVDPIDDVIVADAVDALVESGEMDLGDALDYDDSGLEAADAEPVPDADPTSVIDPTTDGDAMTDVDTEDVSAKEPATDDIPAIVDRSVDDVAPQDAVPAADAPDADTADAPGDQAGTEPPAVDGDGETPAPTEDNAPAPGSTAGDVDVPAATEGQSDAPASEVYEDQPGAPAAAEGSEADPAEKAEDGSQDDPDAKAEDSSQDDPTAKTEEGMEDDPTDKAEEDQEDDPTAKTEENQEAEATAKVEEAPQSAAAQQPAVALEAVATVETSAKGEAGTAEQAAEAAPSALTFGAQKLYMGKGERRAFTVLSADTGAPVEVTLTSSKPAVVKAEGAGVLHARKKGKAKITATAANGVKVTCTVKVVKAPSKLRLTPKKMIIGLNETRALKAKLSKGSASAITWTSSNPAVITVDAAGNVHSVGAGTARITAQTYNRKKASCKVTVLGGHTPKTLSFPAATIYMGIKEKRQLQPVLGAGEAALFTFKTSKKGVVAVNRNGVMTAKKKGTAKITVKTHNGLKFRLTVKVVKAPSKVTLSKSKLSLEVGQGGTLTASLPANAASAIAWTTSDANVATVDAAGNVSALNPGKATITAKTFNGKKVSCTVTVTNPPTSTPSIAQMAANIRNSSLSKRSSLGDIAELLMNNGFEPAFAAGVCANVSHEGNYGFFESSNYKTNYYKRPNYFCYLDGGCHYKKENGVYVKDANGNYVPDVEYVAPEALPNYLQPDGSYKRADGVTVKARYGSEGYYLNKWSHKSIWNINLNELEQFMVDLDKGGWVGKFGLGCTQWTGRRTLRLLTFYRKYTGQGNPTITKEQVIAAEHDMILYDIKGTDSKKGDYWKVYTNWRDENLSNLNSAAAANRAGYRVCRYYEIPAGGEASAVERGKTAVKIYNIMVGAA